MTLPSPIPAGDRPVGLPFETIVEMPRLAGLSDGVFAFALTLLVLEIRIPEGLLASELPAALVSLLPEVLVYVISFVVIGATWGSHQRMVGQLLRGDGPLVWLNLGLLFFITLMPASSALLGRYPGTLLAASLFDANVILIQTAAYLLWRHARAHSLVNQALDPRVAAGIGRRLGLSAAAFAAPLPLHLWRPEAVFVAWMGIGVLLFTTDWLSWQQAGRTRSWSIPIDGVSSGRIQLRHGAGTLRLRRAEPGADLLQGTFGGGVEAEVTRVDDRLDARLQIPQRRGFMSFRYPWTWGPANSLDWDVRLQPSIPLEVSLEISGGQAALDLTGLDDANVQVQGSASEISVVLASGQGQRTLGISSSLCSIHLVTPPGLAVRLRSTRSLRNADFDQSRFVSHGGDREYCSPGFSTAASRVEIDLDVSVGSIELTSEPKADPDGLGSAHSGSPSLPRPGLENAPE